MNTEKITCPTCSKANTWHSENKYKPFCSERCKLIDLGEWASENHKIPGASVDPEIAMAMQHEKDLDIDF